MDVIGTKRQPVDTEAAKIAAMNAIATQVGRIELSPSAPPDMTLIVQAINSLGESVKAMAAAIAKLEKEQKLLDKLDVIRDDSNHRIKTVRVHYKRDM